MFNKLVIISCLSMVVSLTAEANVTFGFDDATNEKEGNRTVKATVVYKDGDEVSDPETKKLDFNTINTFKVPDSAKWVHLELEASVGGKVSPSTCKITKNITNGINYTISLKGASLWGGSFFSCMLEIKEGIKN